MQVGEADMILPPDPGMKREASGNGWAVDVYTPDPPAREQKPPVAPTTGKDGKK